MNMNDKIPWFDFAWLKQWFPEQNRREPHVGKPKRLKTYRLQNMTTQAATKSEVRAHFKKKTGLIFGLPFGVKVEEVK